MSNLLFPAPTVSPGPSRTGGERETVRMCVKATVGRERNSGKVRKEGTKKKKKPCEEQKRVPRKTVPHGQLSWVAEKVEEG